MIKRPNYDAYKQSQFGDLMYEHDLAKYYSTLEKRVNTLENALWILLSKGEEISDTQFRADFHRLLDDSFRHNSIQDKDNV